jgi:hypothetical protein
MAVESSENLRTGLLESFGPRWLPTGATGTVGTRWPRSSSTLPQRLRTCRTERSHRSARRSDARGKPSRTGRPRASLSRSAPNDELTGVITTDRKAHPLGTAWGPHVMRDGERTARLCMPCRAKNRRLTPPTRENALPQFTGGQVVAGSNPLSPDLEKLAAELHLGHLGRRMERFDAAVRVEAHGSVFSVADAHR